MKIKKTLLISSILGFLIGCVLEFCYLLIDISETIGICDDCNFTPFWTVITTVDIINIFQIGFIGFCIGLLIYLSSKMDPKV